MFDLIKQIGVKSYSFRHLADNCDCAKAVLQCDSHVIDLSGPHINYDQPETWAAIKAAYDQNHIQIAGIGVVGMSPDEAKDRKFFEFAKTVDAKLISMTFEPEDWQCTARIIEQLSEEYGILTAIHNHGGYNWLGNETMLNYIFNRTSPRIGLCLDTAWCMHTERCKPVDWMERFGRRIYGFHFKDFTWASNGKHVDAIVGEGSLDLPGTLAKFKELPEVLSAVLEYEGDDTVEATRKSIENIRQLY